MRVIAAVDIRAGRVVQLVGGDPAAARIELDDPVDVALGWARAGFGELHVVDLDAAMGTGDNRDVIARILAAATVPVQVGGGVRDDSAIDFWLSAGAAAVVVGTRAVQDARWLAVQADRHPGSIVVAADVRRGGVATHGWQRSAATGVDAFLDTLDGLPLAGVLVTDIDREGSMKGVNVALFSRLADRTPHQLIASGGVAGPADLEALQTTAVDGVVLGMALYTGAFGAPAAARSRT